MASKLGIRVRWRDREPAVIADMASEDRGSDLAGVTADSSAARPEIVRSQTVQYGAFTVVNQRRRLGQGSYARVVLAQHSVTGRRVALKIFEDADAADARREIQVYQRLHEGNDAFLLSDSVVGPVIDAGKFNEPFTPRPFVRGQCHRVLADRRRSDTLTCQTNPSSRHQARQCAPGSCIPRSISHRLRNVETCQPPRIRKGSVRPNVGDELIAATGVVGRVERLLA